jgi:predicted amidophosphoribosyltransferase
MLGQMHNYPPQPLKITRPLCSRCGANERECGTYCGTCRDKIDYTMKACVLSLAGSAVCLIIAAAVYLWSL